MRVKRVHVTDSPDKHFEYFMIAVQADYHIIALVACKALPRDILHVMTAQLSFMQRRAAGGPEPFLKNLNYAQGLRLPPTSMKVDVMKISLIKHRLMPAPSTVQSVRQRAMASRAQPHACCRNPHPPGPHPPGPSNRT
jgi:hypothetical protein